MSRLRERAAATTLQARRAARRHAGTLIALALLCAFGGGTAALESRAAGASGYDWPQFDGNAQHDGDNRQEIVLAPTNVAGLRRLFRVALPAVADGAPVLLSGVATASGTRDLLFLTTRDGRILARNADDGAVVWDHQYGPGTCRINNSNPGSTSGTPCYTTAAPAIDPDRRYVYGYGLDGYVHKYAVGSGAEVSGNGWPELTTRKDFDEKGSADLSVATVGTTSYLYVAHGGYPGDNGDYQGHVTTINLADGSRHVFNTLCSDQTDTHFVEQPGTPDCAQKQTAVWARAGVVYDPATGKLYVGTGNGPFDANHTTAPNHDWGDSVLALHPDGTSNATGEPLDSYTPNNYPQLQSGDTDLGSTAPAILPVPATSHVQHLAVQSGKDGLLRLLNLDNLSGQGGPGHTGGEVGSPIGVPQGGEVLTQPAAWVNPGDGSTWVFVANGSGISGLRLTVDSGGTPSLHTVWQNGGGGTSPLVANGVLYDAGSNNVQALEPTTGRLLWRDTTIGSIHWESPIVANGILYIADGNASLTAYALNGTEPPTAMPTSAPTSTTPPARATPTTPPAPATATPTSLATPTTPPALAGATPTSLAPTTPPAPATATPTSLAGATAASATATPTTIPPPAASTSTATPLARATAIPTPRAGHGNTHNHRHTDKQRPKQRLVLSLEAPQGVIGGTLTFGVRTVARAHVTVTLRIVVRRVGTVSTVVVHRRRVRRRHARVRVTVLYSVTRSGVTDLHGWFGGHVRLHYRPQRLPRGALLVGIATARPGRTALTGSATLPLVARNAGTAPARR